MKILKNTLWGILIVILILILEYLVTIPFGVEAPAEGTAARFINHEMLLTALPAGLVTFAAAWLLKTKSRSAAFARSVIWTLVLIIFYLSVSAGNYGVKATFGGIGIYVLLACAFAGPIIFAKIKHLK
ncbi:MAG: hypothetical protein ABRQ25_02210 [Clostridiaceae bacterium]